MAHGVCGGEVELRNAREEDGKMMSRLPARVSHNDVEVAGKGES